MVNEIKHNEESVGSRAITITIFVAVIVFLVWLAVQAVGLVPNAFTSLASLADSIYNEDTKDTSIVILDNNAVIDHGETHTLRWADVGLVGNYYFSYECTDGVSVQVEYPKNNIQVLKCGDEIDLGNSNEVAVLISSEQKRFTEVPYSIVFIDTNDELIATDATVTVMNSSIPASQDFGNKDGVVAGEDTTTDTEDEVVVTPTTPTTPAKPQPPVYVEVPVYQIPVSDPKGTVDLAVEIVGVGYMTNANQFVAQSSIDADSKGAVRFKIINLGTKTSDNFTFTAKLPNGQTFKSASQKGLKPNEHSILTLGFTGFEDTGKASFNVDVDVDDDTNKKNNSFSSSVLVKN